MGKPTNFRMFDGLNPIVNAKNPKFSNNTIVGWLDSHNVWLVVSTPLMNISQLG
jgi:hypothetical protein